MFKQVLDIHNHFFLKWKIQKIKNRILKHLELLKIYVTLPILVLRNISAKNPWFESIKIEIESKIDEDENEDVFELTNYERITARAFTLT